MTPLPAGQEPGQAPGPGPSPVGTQRRLRALASQSWTAAALQAETGIPVRLLEAAASDRPSASPHLARAIKEAYDRLWDQDPPVATRQEQQTADATADLASRRGWAPPQAWDDDQIDRPDGQPESGWKPRYSALGSSVDLVEDAEFVRASGGYQDATTAQVAARLGVNPERLAQAYLRARRYAARDAQPGSDHQAQPG